MAVALYIFFSKPITVIIARPSDPVIFETVTSRTRTFVHARSIIVILVGKCVALFIIC